MFTKKSQDFLLAILIALSVGFAGIVFAEAVANQIGYTYNVFNQVQEKQ